MGGRKLSYHEKKSVIINVETHFLNKDGIIYAQSIMDSLFWQKYLNVFDELYVIGRVKKYSGEDLSKWIVSGCEHVHFVSLPEYRGPKGYAANYIQIGRIMKRCIKENMDICCAVIRSPSPLGYRFLKEWRKTKKPFGLEIVANYTDKFYYNIDLPHSVLYGWLHQMTKCYARKADGVAYVTKKVLQKVYPANGIKESYSSIDLPGTFYFMRKPLPERLKEYVMIHVSTLELDVKGNEEFFQTQKNLIEDGYCIRSVVVGGGRYLPYYKQRARALGIKDCVRFTGHISNKGDLMKELQHADLFLFPTLSEGLPRTVIEAMASSLPCVSSDIPSLRELLDKQWLCEPKDVTGFTVKIKELIDNVDIYNSVAKRNYEIACEYEYDVLNKKRMRFYRKLLEKDSEKRI